MNNSLLQQLKRRRLELGLKQNDMILRMGISRQQYQRLESKGNPRLDTLELIAKGLNSKLMLIPKEKLVAVQAVLESDSSQQSQKQPQDKQKKDLSEDPWQDLLEDDQ
ncbi:MAG TPA: helix-turn-helix transcriptional regulator [Gammaproteobacteria bacterium]|nr:helix-turn-helix transcriptional regulator [Gammaproteobacteria bacterium]